MRVISTFIIGFHSQNCSNFKINLREWEVIKAHLRSTTKAQETQVKATTITIIMVFDLAIIITYFAKFKVIETMGVSLSAMGYIKYFYAWHSFNKCICILY